MIVVGSSAPQLEQYAARELQRYLLGQTGTLPRIISDTTPSDAPAFVVGRPGTNTLLRKMVDAGNLTVSGTDPGPQGYVLKKAKVAGRDLLAVAGSDENGVLYGVYGLLTDYYGVSFSFTGDVYPPARTALGLVDVDERKAPRQSVRGILPWTNFPQSATTYSREDYAFIIDQMAKMRMNLLNLHNYNGELRHDESFANFSYNGVRSRPWMATSESGHSWGMPGWRLNDYRFGAASLFDDYAAGSELGLHNDTLANIDVFGKGRALFQWILQYAHSRGVRVSLGIDLNLIPAAYGEKYDAPGVTLARATQLATDYPKLDYVMAYRSETMPASENPTWKANFRTLQQTFIDKGAATRFGVSGWGLDPTFMDDLPTDVIAAPISHYSASFESGAAFGTREYWGTPWLERDFDSSVYYQPYNMNLSDTIASYKAAAANMTGFQALTWRLGGAIDPKGLYLARAPWYGTDKYPTSRSVYQEYAVARYGAAAAADVSPIIDQNETVASLASECCIAGAPPLSGADRSADRQKAQTQIATVDAAIAKTTDASQKARLVELRARLDSELRYVNIDQYLKTAPLAELGDYYRPWEEDFIAQVNDISSLGNIVSTENRYVQTHYVQREFDLSKKAPVLPPVNVTAHGTDQGAIVRWQTREPGASSYQIYRDGTQVAQVPGSATQYTDTTEAGRHSYTVTATVGDVESPKAIADTVETATADTTAPKVIVVSAPSSVAPGSDLYLKARLWDERDDSSLTAALHYRRFGDTEWETVPMTRIARSVFGAAVPMPATPHGPTGVEYYVSGSDGHNTGTFPVAGSAQPASAIITPGTAPADPAAPTALTSTGHELSWSPANARVVRVYRARTPGAALSPTARLTDLPGSTTRFTDTGLDRDGEPLTGRYYYRVSSVDGTGHEGKPGKPVAIDFNTGTRTLTVGASQRIGEKTVPYIGVSNGGFSGDPGYMQDTPGMPVIAFFGQARDQILWQNTGGADSISIRYSNGYPTANHVTLITDGTTQTTLTLPSTKSWDTFRTFKIPQHVRNSVTLRITAADAAANTAAGNQYCCNIDSLTLNGTGDEGESGVLKGVTVYDDPAASGGKAVGSMGEEAGDSITWSNLTGNGLTIRYSNGNSRGIQATVAVDGTVVGTVSFPPTGSWSSYHMMPFWVPVRGPVTIRYEQTDITANDGKPGVKIDAVDTR
ncbi:carbohydrate-binding protein [Streptomyces sp. NBC_00873]|uniref:carbohydrate-binding protein n=1 Tax=unclassified Streptomyces TaxID=2593676 RepID=UPI003870CEEC|nr:carbohydrate-binding protein [Streptomyces sp. NBC_00873]WTA41673.1 carbohydrate-binding protein [Streptomyces sp. NBC_00842]